MKMDYNLKGLLKFEGHYSGLVAASKKMAGYNIQRAERNGYGSYLGTITINLPPVPYFSETYLGMYCKAYYSLNTNQDISFRLYQEKSEMRKLSHPHLSSQEDGSICWDGAPRLREALKKSDYEMALLALYQSVCTVTRGHWRPGLSICEEPGCLNPLEKASYDYCKRHQKQCLWCGKTRSRMVGNSGYCEQCYSESVRFCFKCEKDTPYRRVVGTHVTTSAPDCEYQDFKYEAVYVCDKCMAKSRAKCSYCERAMPKSMLIKISGKLWCSHCQRQRLWREYCVKEDEKWRQQQERRRAATTSTSGH